MEKYLFKLFDLTTHMEQATAAMKDLVEAANEAIGDRVFVDDEADADLECFYDTVLE